MGIFEVLYFGSIIGNCEDRGLIVTTDGVRMNVWQQTDIDTWVELNTIAVRDVNNKSVRALAELANEAMRSVE